MIPSISKNSKWSMRFYRLYLTAFFIYLAIPLIIVAVFAFNDSMFPSLPWEGFTVDWFFNDSEPKLGLFHDRNYLDGIKISLGLAITVTVLSVFVGTCNAFLFENYNFPLKKIFYMLMLIPLVIPGVILGISILTFFSSMANGIEEATGFDIEMFRPGLPLVVMGQLSFIATVSSLVIAARLKKFDHALAEAAFNLGASRFKVLITITLPYLRPAMIGAGVIAFLISFENFNTTLFLSSSEQPITLVMYDRLKIGSTPIINAVSFFLMLISSLLVLFSVFIQRDKNK